MEQIKNDPSISEEDYEWLYQFLCEMLVIPPPADAPVVNLATGNPIAPGSPTGLTTTYNSSSGGVDLNWTASVRGTVDFFRVLRRPKGGVFDYIHGRASTDEPLTGTTYTDTTALPGQTYGYEVIGVNGSGEGSLSSESVVTIPPEKPTGLTASASASVVSLTWDSSSGTTEYRVLRRDIPRDAPGIFHEIATNTNESYADNNVTVGNRYVYRVVAVNSGGSSAKSDFTRVTIPSATPTATPTVMPTATATPTPTVTPAPATPPATPIGLRGMAVNLTIVLEWNAGDSSATHYRVLRRNPAVAAAGVFTEIGTNTHASYIDNNVSANTRYVYRVVAVNAAGESPKSGFVNVTTPAQ